MRRLFCSAFASAIGGGLLALLGAPAAVAVPMPTECVGSDFVSLGGSGQSGVGSCEVGLRMVLLGSDGTCSPGGGGACQATPCQSQLLIYYRCVCPAFIFYSLYLNQDPGGDGTIGSLPAVGTWTAAAPPISIDIPDGSTLQCSGWIQAGTDVAYATASAECTSCMSGTGGQ